MEDPFLCLIFGPANRGMMERSRSSAWGLVAIRDPPLVPSPQGLLLTSTGGGGCTVPPRRRHPKLRSAGPTMRLGCGVSALGRASSPSGSLESTFGPAHEVTTDFTVRKKTRACLAARSKNITGVRKVDADGRGSVDSAEEEGRGVHRSRSLRAVRASLQVESWSQAAS